MDKHRFSGIIMIPAILVIVTLLAGNSNAQAAGSGSLVPNGDFESGEKTGWSGYGCRLEIVNDDVYRGNYACRAWLDQEWGGGHRTTIKAPGGRYRVVMYVKTSPGMKGQCLVGAENFDGLKISMPIRTHGSWVEVSFEVRTKGTGFDLYTRGPKTPGGWILLDEVTVTPME